MAGSPYAVLGVMRGGCTGGAPLGVPARWDRGAHGVLCATLSVLYPSRGGSVVFVDRVFGARLATGAFEQPALVRLPGHPSPSTPWPSPTGGDGNPTHPVRLLVAPAPARISAAILVPAGLNLLSASIVAETETALVVLKLAILALVVGAGMTSVRGSRLALDTWPSIPAVAAPGMLVSPTRDSS
ncbi:MAG: hypothetical protein R2716_13635 [Microthrixaceae bacterium]